MARSVLVLAALLAGSLAAQNPPPVAAGYDAREVLRETGHAFGFAGFAPGAAPGELFYAVAHAVWHRDAGGRVTLVRAFDVRARCDLLVHPPGSRSLYYADDQGGALIVRDLDRGTETTRPFPRQTFDLVELPTGELLVSANPRWPATGARPGIWQIDPRGGNAHREIATLDGTSGPLVVDPATGDLLYATASPTFPTPPGSVRVLRFPAARIAAAVAGGPALAARDATVHASGLDGAFDLAFDDRGHLLVSNPQDGRVERVRPDGALDPVPLVPPQARSALGLAFVDGGPATFAPWQPGDGGVLLVGENDWSTFAGVRAIRPARPVCRSASGPTAGPGALAIELSGLPPQQTFWLSFNHLPLWPRERALLHVGGVPVWWGVDLLVPPISVPVRANAAGDARLDLGYRGGLTWTLAFQAAGLSSASGTPLVVTTTPVAVTLLP